MSDLTRPDAITALPEYMMGWDEETIYLDRAAYATAEDATAAFRRIALEELDWTADEIEGIDAVAETVPSHDDDEGTHNFDGPCPDCHPADVWRFAP